VEQEQSEEQQEEQQEEEPQEEEQNGDSDDGDSGDGDSGEEASGDSDKTEAEVEAEKLQERVKELEENPPEKLEDWPEDEAKYETFGGPEGEHGYHEGPEQQLGPASLRHHEDGSVEIEGEKVDDPENYKGEPVPGGPTDPDTPQTRMDKAAPEDRSEVAMKASGEEGDEESEGEESEGEESEESED
jgi:hypothetical protein